jgi:hypothetical protein
MRELKISAARQDRSLLISAEDKMGLAFNYLGAGAWQKALDVFQTYSNRPVFMGNGGLWGRPFTPVLTYNEAAYCRKKLGLPNESDPREFDMGKPLVCLHQPSKIAVVSDGLWIGIGDQLVHLNFDLQTNLTVGLPISGSAPITCLCIGSSNLWIGTDGDGLVEVDKATRKCRQLTEKDGLMMDHISSLFLDHGLLWIGYGHQSGGGLGQLDIVSRRLKSFTRSLLASAGVQNNPSGDQAPAQKEQPPHRLVFAITTSPDGVIWLLGDGSPLREYRPREDVWSTPTDVRDDCLAADSERLFLGRYDSQYDHGLERNKSCELGVRVLNFKDGQSRSFN